MLSFTVRRALHRASAPVLRAVRPRLVLPAAAAIVPRLVARFFTTRPGDNNEHGHSHADGQPCHGHEHSHAHGDAGAHEQHAEPIDPKDAELVARVQGLNNEMGAAIDKAQWGEALKLGEEALAVIEAHFGKAHPAYASALNNLGYVWRRQGNVDRAVLMYQQAFDTYQVAVGREHRSTLTAALNLAMALRAHAENHPRAIALLAENNTCYAKQLETVPDEQVEEMTQAFLASSSSIAAMQIEADKLAEAEWHCWHALTRLMEIFGDNNVPVSTALNNLGFVYMRRGQFAMARPLVRKAKEIRDRLLPPEHSAVQQIAANLAQLDQLEREAGAAAAKQSDAPQ